MKKLFLSVVVLYISLAASSAFAEDALHGLPGLGSVVTIDKAADRNSALIKGMEISGAKSISYDARNGIFCTVWLNDTTTPHQVALGKIGLAVGVRWLY